MDLRQLRYFVAVAEERHFGRAADRLHISQPPLSLAIKQLEEEIGVALLTRERGVELTTAGQAFLTEARKLLEHAASAAETARLAERGITGTVSIGYSSSVPPTGLIARTIIEYRQRRPAVRLLLKELPAMQLFPMAADGEIDVLFVRQPFSMTHPALESKSIYRERLMVALPRQHRFAEREQIRLADLSEEDFIVYPQGLILRDLVLRVTQAAGFFVRIGQETPHISSILELLAAGLGVSLLPESASSIAPANIRFVACDATETADVSLVWRKQESSEAVKQFVDTALSANPPVTATARPSQTAAAAHVDSSSTDRHNRG